MKGNIKVYKYRSTTQSKVIREDFPEDYKYSEVIKIVIVEMKGLVWTDSRS